MLTNVEPSFQSIVDAAIIAEHFGLHTKMFTSLLFHRLADLQTCHDITNDEVPGPDDPTGPGDPVVRLSAGGANDISKLTVGLRTTLLSNEGFFDVVIRDPRVLDVVAPMSRQGPETSDTDSRAAAATSSIPGLGAPLYASRSAEDVGAREARLERIATAYPMRYVAIRMAASAIARTGKSIRVGVTHFDAYYVGVDWEIKHKTLFGEVPCVVIPAWYARKIFTKARFGDPYGRAAAFQCPYETTGCPEVREGPDSEDAPADRPDLQVITDRFLRVLGDSSKNGTIPITHGLVDPRYAYSILKPFLDRGSLRGDVYLWATMASRDASAFAVMTDEEIRENSRYIGVMVHIEMQVRSYEKTVDMFSQSSDSPGGDDPAYQPSIEELAASDSESDAESGSDYESESDDEITEDHGTPNGGNGNDSGGSVPVMRLNRFVPFAEAMQTLRNDGFEGSGFQLVRALTTVYWALEHLNIAADSAQRAQAMLQHDDVPIAHAEQVEMEAEASAHYMRARMHMMEDPSGITGLRFSLDFRDQDDHEEVYREYATGARETTMGYEQALGVGSTRDFYRFNRFALREGPHIPPKTWSILRRFLFAELDLVP